MIKNLFQREINRVIMLILKNVFKGDYIQQNLPYILEAGKTFLASKEGEHFLKSLIIYLLSATDATAEVIIDNAGKISQAGGELAMTTADRLMEKGYEKGRKEGIEKKAFETAKKMKQDGVPLSKLAQYTGLSEEKIKEL